MGKNLKFEKTSNLKAPLPVSRNSNDLKFKTGQSISFHNYRWLGNNLTWEKGASFI